MAIMDSLTPKYYEVLDLGIQRQNGDVVASYNVIIRNVLGNKMRIINLDSVLTAQERQAVAAIFQRDVEAFETATGLERWIPPEENV